MPWPSSGPDVAPDAGDRFESRSGLGRPRRAAIPAMVPPFVVRVVGAVAPARPVTPEVAGSSPVAPVLFTSRSGSADEGSDRSEPSICQVLSDSGAGEDATERIGQPAGRAVSVLDGGELVRIDVQGDAGTGVSHLTTDGYHVRALADEVRAERVA